MTGHPIFTVTLVFAPPGPLHCAMLVAPNLETAVAMVTLEAAKVAGDAHLAAVVASELPADALRRILRAAEGQAGPAELLSLVPKAEADLDAWQKLGDAAAPIVERTQRAAEILRQHPETPVADLSWAKGAPLDAADAATFTGPAVDHLWPPRDPAA